MEIIDSESSPSEFPDCDAMVFVFSTASIATFDSLLAYRSKLITLPPHCLFALVGTMTDLSPQKVQYEAGLRLAQDLQAGYFLVSNPQIHKVEAVFDYLLGRYVHRPKPSTLHQALEPPKSRWRALQIPDWMRTKLLMDGRRKT